MYESITYESILKRMLDKITSKIDKREGSIIYDAIAPAAVEIQLMYIEFDNILQETFGDTASRDFLIRRASERGITPFSATCAVFQAKFIPSNIDITIGSRFSCGNLNYYVKSKVKDGIYQLQCEQPGINANHQPDHSNQLIPIAYIDGLQTANLLDLLIPGEDAEDTEDLRKRYFDSFTIKTYGGNIDDYLHQTNAIEGVGSTKVTPVWSGGGTVKLTILNGDFAKASQILIDTVQNIIDPTQDGFGVGIAPIGHIVTVDTVKEIEINISTSIYFQSGYSFVQLKQSILDAISDYFLELRKSWSSEDNIIVRISQIDTKILNIRGIIDITGTAINNKNTNLILYKYQIPKLGDISNV